MTPVNRWLSDLPEDAPERAVLVAGRSDAPSREAVEQGFLALSAAIGAATSTAYIGTAAAKAATTATVTTSTSLVTLAAKPILIGFVLGSGLVGGAFVTERSQKRTLPRATVTQSVPSRPAQQTTRVAIPAVSASPSTENAPVEPTVNERLTPSKRSFTVAKVADPTVAATEPDLSLAEEARQLAQIKRLLSASNSAEAMTRLSQTEPFVAKSALAEEHEALFIEALAQEHKVAAARARAVRFLIRFPNSPHRVKMRQLSELE